MSKIIITIQNGEITSKVKGIKGIECNNADKFLKQLGKVVEVNKTKEYYQAETEVKNYVKL